jgi:hypothetical protein
MAKCIRKITYRCSDDCIHEGCPTHVAKLIYHSVVDMYCFKFEKKTLTKNENKELVFDEELCFQRGEMQAIIHLLKEVNLLKELDTPILEDNILETDISDYD